jgi:hypothetical protein
MARIVAGFASSHTPLMSLPGQDWAKRVAAAGAMGETPMDLITYQPGYRSPAGTGCGCAVGRWIPE